ncbi:hypothetical protein PBY51_023224 [Eleginops maclovinus]|uniref:Uncharacterized protein n=1 Tax=Eleginops maclovinus TaxID=56733 RepID=A0AAN7WTR4_ELEMC|nr:hypothetical protein PBY51_023224 [Eleginops maclovinus]
MSSIWRGQAPGLQLCLWKHHDGNMEKFPGRRVSDGFDHYEQEEEKKEVPADDQQTRSDFIYDHQRQLITARLLCT